MVRRRDKGDKIKKGMTYFIIFLMVGSLFGVIFLGFSSGGAPSHRYGEYRFFDRGDHFQATIDGRVAAVSYLPNHVEHIEIPPEVSNRLRNTVQFDITSDINDTHAEGIALAQFQLALTLQNFQLFMRSGFTSENEFNQPVITCDDATQFVPVTYFRKANETAIYLENNCIIVDILNPVDVIRVKDRLVFDILGIIQ